VNVSILVGGRQIKILGCCSSIDVRKMCTLVCFLSCMGLDCIECVKIRIYGVYNLIRPVLDIFPLPTNYMH